MAGISQPGTQVIIVDPVTREPVTVVAGVLQVGGPSGGEAVSIADGANVAQGALADAAVVTDANGTVSGKLRGLVKIFADVWDSVNHRLNVSSAPIADTVTAGTISAADALVGGSGAALAVGVLAGQAPTVSSFVTATLAAQGTVAITLTPAVSAGSLVVEVSEDSTNFRPAVMAPGVAWSVTTASMIRVDVGGFVKVRVRAVAGTAFGGGPVSVSINATVREAGVFVASGTITANPALSAVLVAAGTATTQTKTIAVAGNRSLVLVLNTATASGGNTVQVTINGVTASGYVYPILVGVAVAAVAVTPYRVGVGLTPSANSVANDVLPASIQVVSTVAGTVAYGIDSLLGA